MSANTETIMADRGAYMLQPLTVHQPPVELAMSPALLYSKH